jgi:hypothetical protein
MYKLFLIIILFLFFIINHLLKKNYENFDSTDITSDDIEDSTKSSWKRFCGVSSLNFNNNSSSKKKYINQDEEEITLTNCAKENEKCYVDPKGNNTCCGDFNCVRLKNNFGYKVCSHQKDACGYFKNDYLRFIFDDEWWDKIYEDLKNLFKKDKKHYVKQEDIEEEDDILKNKRKEILDFIQIRGLCGEKYSTEEIKKQLDKFFTNDQVFSGLIYGVKKLASDDNEEKDNISDSGNRSRCKLQQTTVNNY